MISVVVPAHDEAAVIESGLRALSEGAREGELEVIVVCNGCHDDTAERARAFGGPVRVVETDQASKAIALQLGDQAARGFPRFYVDADVTLPLASVRRVAEALGSGPALAAAPRLRVDLEGCSWPVRAYYDIWTRLPYHTDGMIGSGVYALSEAGRARFEAFPDIISDDGFVRLCFRREERATVESAWFSIRAPATLRGVLAVKTRSQKGLIQLQRRFPELQRNESRDYRGPLRSLLRDPRRWPACAVYLGVLSFTKARGWWLNRVGDLGAWERDESSRRDAGDRARAGS